MDWLLKSINTWQDLIPLLVIMWIHLKDQSKAHKATIVELKAIKVGQEELTLSIARHSVLLEQTAREFAKIEEHQKVQDVRINDLNTRISEIKH